MNDKVFSREYANQYHLLFLAQAGLELVSLSAFLGLAQHAHVATWNALAIGELPLEALA